MKATRFTTIGLAVLGLILVAWLVLTVITYSTEKKSGPAATDDKHCPVCRRELPLASRASGECPFCKVEEAANGGKGKRLSRNSAAMNPILPVVLFSTFCVLLGIHVWLALRKRSWQNKEEILYITNCGKCRRRVRYRPDQIGHAALCPLCRKPIIFRQPDDPAPRRLWQLITKW
jgi:hypothetical protein